MGLAELRHYPVLIGLIFICGLSGSFHYGYNISVMNSPSKFIKELMNDTSAERYGTTMKQWQVSLLWSFTVSVFTLGGFIGSLAAGFLLAHIGRKTCLLLNGGLAMVAAVLMLCSKVARSFEMVFVARFLYGINAGVGISAHTMYITECAPKSLKGMVGVTVTIFTCFGRFCGQLLGIGELLGNEGYWFVLLGLICITASLQLGFLPLLPESPSFLLHDRGDRPACERALKMLWGDGDHSRVVEDMLEEKAAMAAVRSNSLPELIRDKKVRSQLLILIVTFVSLPLSGVIAVYFYSFEVFRAAGIDELLFPYFAMGMGLCEWIFSLLSFVLFERKGARILLMTGYGAMSVTLLLLIITLLLQWCGPWMPFISMGLIFVFISCCAVGPGAVTGPLPGQIFPHAYKSTAFALGASLSWLTLFVVGMTFSYMIEVMDHYCFIIFMCVCAGCALFVKCKLPDIRNQSLQEVIASFETINMSGEPAAAPEGGANEDDVVETRL